VRSAKLDNLAGMNVLVVCTGNTCRSPMAEMILRRLAEDHGLTWDIGSAGLRAETSIAPSAVRALRRRGIAVAGRRAAVQLTGEMMHEASVVFCMTENQRASLAEAMPANAAKVHCWGAFLATKTGPRRQPPHLIDAGPGPAKYDVVDPAGGDDDVYEQTATTIDTLAAMTIEVLSASSRRSPR
jgi:protein-tyrosine-phosphatase